MYAAESTVGHQGHDIAAAIELEATASHRDDWPFEPELGPPGVPRDDKPPEPTE